MQNIAKATKFAPPSAKQHYRDVLKRRLGEDYGRLQAGAAELMNRETQTAKRRGW